MAYGRKTGGRKKGTPNKIQRPGKKQSALVDKLFDEGVTPLEYMLAILRNPESQAMQKAWAAEKAAPYCHPRLAPVDKDTGQQPVQKVQIIAWQGPRQPKQ